MVRSRRAPVRVLLAVLSGLVATGLAGPAHGDPVGNGASQTDSAFLAALRAAGITYSRADQAITSAKVVCGLIAGGKPSPEVLAALTARNPGLTTERGTQFVGIAARSYCPDQLVPTGARGGG